VEEGLPRNDLSTTRSNCEEGKKGKNHRDAETPDWYSTIGALSEESWRVAVEGQRVEGSRGAITVTISGYQRIRDVLGFTRMNYQLKRYW